jgi:hypothetical protein
LQTWGGTKDGVLVEGDVRWDVARIDGVESAVAE